MRHTSDLWPDDRKKTMVLLASESTARQGAPLGLWPSAIFPASLRYSFRPGSKINRDEQASSDRSRTTPNDPPAARLCFLGTNPGMEKPNHSANYRKNSVGITNPKKLRVRSWPFMEPGPAGLSAAVYGSLRGSQNCGPLSVGAVGGPGPAAAPKIEKLSGLFRTVSARADLMETCQRTGRFVLARNSCSIRERRFAVIFQTGKGASVILPMDTKIVARACDLRHPALT